MIEALAWPLVALAAVCVGGCLADRWVMGTRQAKALRADLEQRVQIMGEACAASIGRVQKQVEDLQNQLTAFENRVGRR